MYFCYFIIIPSLEKECPNLNKLESSSPKNALSQVWLKLAQWSRRRKFFEISLMYFHYFVIISHWKKVKPLLCTHLNSSPTNALCQVWLKFVLWFWRRRFSNCVNEFLLFHYYFPLEKGGVLYLNQHIIPFT